MLGTKCQRKLYYSSAGVEEDYPFGYDGLRRMLIGDAVHSALHQIFKRAGVLIEYYNPDGSIPKDWKNPENDDREFPLSSEDLYIKRGKIDAILKIDGQLWIGEYKSINMNGFSTLTAPKSDHIIQAVTYFYVFNKMLADGAFKHIKELDGFEKASGVKWLYVNKDDTELKEYHMTDTDPVFHNIVNRILGIRDHYDKKVLPAKTPEYCTSCNWRTKCKKNYNI